jgi:hypothetical protein
MGVGGEDKGRKKKKKDKKMMVWDPSQAAFYRFVETTL